MCMRRLSSIINKILFKNFQVTLSRVPGRVPANIFDIDFTTGDGSSGQWTVAEMLVEFDIINCSKQKSTGMTCCCIFFDIYFRISETFRSPYIWEYFLISFSEMLEEVVGVPILVQMSITCTPNDIKKHLMEATEFPFRQLAKIKKVVLRLPFKLGLVYFIAITFSILSVMQSGFSLSLKKLPCIIAFKSSYAVKIPLTKYSVFGFEMPSFVPK